MMKMKSYQKNNRLKGTEALNNRMFEEIITIMINQSP